MSDAAYQRKPLRMSFTNLNNGRSLEAQFNPEELNELLQANWTDLEVPGLPHQPSQYISTENGSYDLTLAFDAYDNGGGSCVTNDPSILGQERSAGRTQNRLADIMLARNYLHSLFYPPATAQGINGGAPPRFLFVWPNLISLTCKISRCAIKYKRFNLKGQPTFFDAELAIAEIRDRRLDSDSVFFDGTFRHTIPENV